MCCTGCNSDKNLRKFEKVCEIINKYDHQPNKLIPILQEIQKEYRYLPEKVQSYVATSLGIPPARVFGVASFYANFALKPKGKYVVHVCNGTACYVKGSTAIVDALYKKLGLSNEKPTSDDMLFTIETVSCLGACGLAPVITINGKVHGQMNAEKATSLIDEIVTKEQNNDK
ncbi:MAG TPA: NAD(P)H-dependent oxidoreductase subunit E [Sedimentisphaerales bacterium]|nr:NAD(P)H-dependent oxidoreductase subunit E [Sedimentisphaerales bacterium]